jgi:hypothetical protein
MDSPLFDVVFHESALAFAPDLHDELRRKSEPKADLATQWCEVLAHRTSLLPTPPREYRSKYPDWLKADERMRMNKFKDVRGLALCLQIKFGLRILLLAALNSDGLANTRIFRVPWELFDESTYGPPCL